MVEITWENWHVEVLEGLTRQSNCCDSTIILFIKMILILSSSVFDVLAMAVSSTVGQFQQTSYDL